VKGSEALRNVVFKSREMVPYAVGRKRGTRPIYGTSKVTEPVPDKCTTDGDMFSSTAVQQIILGGEGDTTSFPSLRNTAILIWRN
jgi:hypothetical protein